MSLHDVFGGAQQASPQPLELRFLARVQGQGVSVLEQLARRAKVPAREQLPRVAQQARGVHKGTEAGNMPHVHGATSRRSGDGVSAAPKAASPWRADPL